MTTFEKHRKTWPGKSDDWLFERLELELKEKVSEIHRLIDEKQKMSTTNLYVIVNKGFGNNSTQDALVTHQVYMSITEAENDITNKDTMTVIDLEDWAQENYDCGYIHAYG